MHMRSRTRRARPALLSSLSFLLFISSTACAPSGPQHSPEYVDLSQLSVCARAGFETEWLRAPAPRIENLDGDCDPDWTRIAGSSAGSRPLDLRGLWPQLELDYPRRKFLEPVDPRFSGERFSLRFSFRVDSVPVPPQREDDRALVLGSIGNNWEIYLNGSLVEREV